jgi:hypothetical protein
MVDQSLFENLNRLGVSMMEVQNDVDVASTITEVVKSKDSRLWEAFPVLLANAAQEYDFHYDQALNHLTTRKDQKNFHDLLLLSLAVYQHFLLSFHWAKQLKKVFSDQELEKMKQYKKSLSTGDVLTLGDKEFYADRLKTVFNNYFEKAANKTKRVKEKHEDLSLEFALSQLFSPKQKELFKKKLNGERLTKTEREYYSRAVKKKVSALANPELHRLAQKLIAY